MDYDLTRFIEAQAGHSVDGVDYDKALTEIRNGRKDTHWIWYIFPQLKALGKSSIAEFYGIQDLEEAKAYMEHPILGERLIEISSALLSLDTNNAVEVMSSTTDYRKLKSCMTLFGIVAESEEVFQKVLDKYYCGEKDDKTLGFLGL